MNEKVNKVVEEKLRTEAQRFPFYAYIQLIDAS